MQVMTIRSGSNANCILVKQKNYGILIDAGVGIRTLNSALKSEDLDIDRIAAIFITHEHSDHIKGLETILKNRNIPLFANEATLSAISDRLYFEPKSAHILPTGSTAACPDMEVKSFRTPHDAIESVGYTVTDGVRKFSLATDLGVMTKEVFAAIGKSHALVLESNYDPHMLQYGPYPMMLKKRIFSERGHLSNEDCAKFAAILATHGTEKIILGHLSQNNNTPELAYKSTAQALIEKDIRVNSDVLLYTASRMEASPIFEV